MKKKFISLVVFLFAIFFIGNIEVFASNNPYPISSHDIPSDTYIIGTHAFDENRTYLSTQDIMWAARTIDAETIDDMIIYYKDMNGIWIDGLTGENLTVPSTFKLEEINGEEISLVLINVVLEEYEVDGGEGYSSLHTDDYSEIGFHINLEENKTEYNYNIIFDAYNVKDGEYNLDLKCHKYVIEDEGFTPTSFEIGTIPTKIEVSNGIFRIPVKITSTDFDYVSCAMDLNQDEETISSGFIIDVGEPEASLEASVIGVGYESEEGAGSGVIHSDTGSFYLINDETLTKNFEIAFMSRYIEEGDYKLEVNVFKDDDLVNTTSPDVISVGEGVDEIYGFANAKVQLTFEDKIENGEYEFQVILYNSLDEVVVTEYFYLVVSDETNMEMFSEIWETTNHNEIYHSRDEFSFDSSITRTFHAGFLTENIQTGTYAVKAQLEYVDMVIPANFDFIANQNVEVIKTEEIEYFDYDFKIPKGAGSGRYNVFITLHELIEDDEFGGMIVSAQPIAKTSFTFTIEEEILYGDINLDGKVDIGDATMVLRYVNDLDELTDDELTRADVNCDGFINMVDALLIQGFELGYYPNTLPNTQIENYVLYGDTLDSGDLYRGESPQAYYVLEQYLNGNTDILTGQALKNADVNGDNNINHIDKALIYGYINELVQFNLPSLVPITEYILYGDATNDGIISQDDAYLISQYISGSGTISSQGLKNADINNDGNIDNNDYEIINQGIIDGIFEANMPLFTPIINN